MCADKPFGTPESSGLSAPLADDQHPAIHLFYRLFWVWIAATGGPVIAGIFIACTAADLPADLADADGPYFIADAHMLLLVGILLVAYICTTIRLYHMRRSANWHARFVTIAGYLLTLVDMGDAQPVAPVDELLSSISDLAWGGILALAFVEPLRSRYAGTSLSSSGGANV